MQIGTSHRPFGLTPEVDSRLARLERRYRVALSGAVAAKARYLSMRDEPGATARAVQVARSEWLRLDAIRHMLVARMAELDSLPSVGSN